jgi:hypothetical protein
MFGFSKVEIGVPSGADLVRGGFLTGVRSQSVTGSSGGTLAWGCADCAGEGTLAAHSDGMAGTSEETSGRKDLKDIENRRATRRSRTGDLLIRKTDQGETERNQEELSGQKTEDQD